ncbi:MAG: ral stress protein 13 [Planctomycetota bacterium]|jgi:transcriptional accessory protein Tex/SPT6
MIDLSTIAAELQLQPDQLRVATDLLSQGCEPSFIANYRADEIGGLSEKTLWRLKDSLDKQKTLAAAREKAQQELSNASMTSSGFERCLNEAKTIRDIERILRPLHSKKNAHNFAERHPQAAALVEALRSDSAPTVDQLSQWVVERFGVESSQVDILLGQARHLIVLKLSENPVLTTNLRRQIAKKAILTAKVVNDGGNGNTKTDKPAPASSPATETAASQAAAAVAAEQKEEQVEITPITNDEDLAEELLADQEVEALEETEATSESPDVNSQQSTSETTNSEQLSPAANASAPAPKKSGNRGNKGEARLTPRQRRRRWLQSMLQPFDGLKKPLNKLSSFQIVMLARGQRTQLIRTNLEYDRPSLVLMATESLVPSQHPLTNWMDEVATEALGRVILPRLEQDVLNDIEEQAHERLTSIAGNQFLKLVAQRPLRGHRILCIDAVGPKLAPVAIIDHNGEVLAIDEIPCQNNKADNKSSLVTKLGEIVHRHRVSLIALSNGPARRSILPAVAELLEQSTPGSVRFTFVDRTGADAYTTTKISADELGKFSRRHRGAIWMARRLQDARQEILKVDFARLRLGSYQGELSADRLRSALQDVVAASLTVDGVDVHRASESGLLRVPGMTPEVASTIVKLRDSGQLTSRAALTEALNTIWPSQLMRQAIGFLRLYNSPQSLDGTVIHPDDYHLATRLATALGLSLPAACPDGWSASRGKAGPDVSSKNPGETASIAEGAAETSADQNATSNDAEAPPLGDSHVDPPQQESATTELTGEPKSEENPSSEGGSPSQLTTAESSVSDHETITPEIEVGAVTAVPMLDIEKYAKSWQVGREKLKKISRALQVPFEDKRLSNSMIPLLTKIPKIEDLQPGMSLWGIIVGLADFGAFAELGIECQGLIHVSKLASGFVEDPHQFVQIGDLVQVWVVSIDREKKRISLSAISPGEESSAQIRNDRGASDEPGRGFGTRVSDGGRGNGPGRGPSGRGGGDRGPAGRGPGGGSSGGDNRGGGRPPRSDSGNRGSGGFRGAESSGRGGPDRGGPGRGGPRRGDAGRGRNNPRGQASDDTSPQDSSVSKPKITRPSKPATPLTQGMQSGKEPLRSFADLMQYYQTQKDPPPSPPKNEEPSPSSEEGPKGEATSE